MPQPNPELFERLINEVRKRECLFLPSHPQYKDRLTIQAEWMAIGEELGISAEEAKKTWQNLRSSYSRCLAGGKSLGKPWYLRKQMDFLYPYMNLAPNGSGEASSSEEFAFPIDIPIKAEEMTSPVEGEDMKPTAHIIRPSVAKKQKVTSPYCVHGATTTNSSSSSRKFTVDGTDEDLIFFKGLLPSIKELSKSNKRKFKRVVSNFLFDMLEAQETQETAEQIPEMQTTLEHT